MPEDIQMDDRAVQLSWEEWRSVLAVLEMVDRYKDYDQEALKEIGTLRSKIQQQVASAN